MNNEEAEVPETLLTDAELQLMQRAAAVRDLDVSDAATVFYREQLAEQFGRGRRRTSGRVYDLRCSN